MKHDNGMGRLKKTLKERCPDCGKNLQVRMLDEVTIKGEQKMTISVEYIICSSPDCGYERNMEKSRSWRQEE